MMDRICVPDIVSCKDKANNCARASEGRVSLDGKNGSAHFYRTACTRNTMCGVSGPTCSCLSSGRES